MKSNGFTLIELLVVVAIISILASLGVVTYNGYNKVAKKNAARSNNTQIIKYFSAELQKCNIGDSKFIENSINCSDRFENYKITIPAESILWGKFKNPYKNQNLPQHGSLGFSCSKNTEGETKIENKNSILQVQTCVDDIELLTYKIIIE